MHLVNIFEKIILWFKMILSTRSSKYHLKSNFPLKKYFNLIFTPPNSFIQWVYLIWWVISKMMMKILMINFEIIITKTKYIKIIENDWKKIHFIDFMDVNKVYFHKIMLNDWKWMDFKKVCFHKIVLDEWKGMNFVDFHQLHSFLIFIQFECIL